MKKLLCIWLSVALSMIFVPLISYNAGMGAEHSGAQQLSNSAEGESAGADENFPISVFMADSESVETMPLRDYLICALAGEMPAAYEPAALSAQALASLTLVMRLYGTGRDDSLKGAVISTDSKKHQSYMSVEAMRERWGDDFQKYYDKLSAAVDEIFNFEITYKGEPILAAFHAISAGKTEDASNVWLSGEDYLISVESEGDSFSPKFASSLSVSAAEFSQKLSSELPVKFSGEPSGWLGESEYTPAGTLKSIKICETSVTGAGLREIFGLRSAAITLSFSEDSFKFNVKGYGHGVGLSQYGADYYARQGMGWREIIAHYYPGTQISER